MNDQTFDMVTGDLIHLVSAIHAYATRWILHMEGHGKYPGITGLTSEQASYVRGIVSAASVAGAARRKGDDAKEAYWLNEGNRLCYSVVRYNAMPRAVARSLFDSVFTMTCDGTLS